jgi:hypothetical protein
MITLASNRSRDATSSSTTPSVRRPIIPAYYHTLTGSRELLSNAATPAHRDAPLPLIRSQVARTLVMAGYQKEVCLFASKYSRSGSRVTLSMIVRSDGTQAMLTLISVHAVIHDSPLASL